MARPRDYCLEHVAASVPRLRVTSHPLVPSEDAGAAAAESTAAATHTALSPNPLTDDQVAAPVSAAAFGLAVGTEASQRRVTSWKTASAAMTQRHADWLAAQGRSSASDRATLRLQHLRAGVAGSAPDAQTAAATAAADTAAAITADADAATARLRTQWQTGDKRGCFDHALALLTSLAAVPTPDEADQLAVYPLRVVQAVRVADVLADLVLARMRATAASPSTRRDPCAQAGEQQERALYWLHRCVTLFQVLPRVYLEAALLPLHALLQGEGVCAAAMRRLVLWCRGVTELVPSAYLRAYLCQRIASAPLPLPRDQRSSLVLLCMQDHFAMVGAAPLPSHTRTDVAHAIDLPTQCLLAAMCRLAPVPPPLSPALDAFQPRCFSASVLREILRYTACDDVARVLPRLLDLIANATSSVTFATRADVVYVTALALAQYCPSSLRAADDALRQLWTFAMQLLQRPRDQLAVAAALAASMTTSCTDALRRDFLADVAHLADAASEHEAAADAALVLQAAITHAGDIAAVLSSPASMALLQQAPQSSRPALASAVLRLIAQPAAAAVTDAAVVALALDMAQELAASLARPGATVDDVRSYQALVVCVIRRIALPRGRMLRLLQQCRSCLHRLPVVAHECVYAALRLAVAASSPTEPSPLTSTRPLLAFAITTTASCEPAAARCLLRLLTAQVCCRVRATAQAEWCVRAIAADLTDPACDIDDAVAADLLVQLAGFLVALPGVSDTDVGADACQLLRIIADTEAARAWRTSLASGAARVRVLAALLAAAAASAQNTLPYAAPGLPGNDLLYPGDSDRHAAASELMRAAGVRALAHLRDVPMGHARADTVFATAVRTVLSAVHVHSCCCSDTTSLVRDLASFLPSRDPVVVAARQRFSLDAV